MNPLISLVAIGAVLAVMAWKPQQHKSTKDTEIQPLRKDDDEGDI